MTDVADALRAHFDTGATATRRWRVTQLRALRDLLRRHQHRIEAALAADLGKPAAEVVITEIGPVIGEIDHALRRLRRWMRPRRVRLPYQYLPARARVLRHDCSRGLHLDQRQPPRTRRDDEIHLETLRVAEVVELAPPAGGRLPLRDLRGDEPLVHRSHERRTLQFLG